MIAGHLRLGGRAVYEITLLSGIGVYVNRRLLRFPCLAPLSPK
jgi:hypothetical protein